MLVVNQILRSLGLVVALACPASAAAALQQQVQEARARETNRREAWQRVPEVLVAVGAVPGARLADVGAGDGFFTVRLARAVGPEGRVIGEDVDGTALDRLRTHLAEEALTNVDVVLGEAGDPHLPLGTLDGVLIVNAYHEMRDFSSMLEHIRRALKPGGRLVLVEPFDRRLRAESRTDQTAKHSLAPGFAEDELRSAGFFVVSLRDPFTRGDQELWLMVAQPAEAATTGAAPARPLAGEAPGPSGSEGMTPEHPGSESELASPELRVSQQEFAALLEAGRVLVLDVRGADDYEAGHIPGAQLVPLADLGQHLDALRPETRPIVTYCT